MISIQCLMVNGGALDNRARTALLLAACSMIRSGKKSARLKDANFEGGVSTKRQRKFVSGYLQGIEFHAIVEFGDQTIRCRFLVGDKNLPSDELLLAYGSWTGEISFGDFQPVTSSDESIYRDPDWWKK